MGSVSDYEVMADAVAMLGQFGVDFEKRVVSAHRTPDLLCEYAKTAKNRGIGVMPAGVPVATTAINGAKNAALIAVSILALQDAELAARLEAFRAKQTADVLAAEL